MKRQLLRVTACVMAFALAAPAAAEEFQVRLSRVPVDSRNQASITGLGRATAELDGDRLEIAGEFRGLQGPATVANLHMGPAVGVRGPVVQALSVSTAAAGELEGTVRLNAEQTEALRAGRLYIQVHSESAPDGNLWGWLRDE